MNVLGIMNGTSIDGVDYVWLKITDKTFKFLKHIHKDFSKTIKDQLIQASLNQCSTYEIGELHFALGREYQKHFQSFKRLPFKTHLIGLHGQTIYHHGRYATLQIGEPSYLAHQAQVPVVFNFRAGDVARGGEGAPFAPIFHKELLKGYKEPVAFHNLGGISNVTYISSKRKIAFDTGPANILMDLWMQKKKKQNFDQDGRCASQGIAEPKLVKTFMSHYFLKQRPPKSCGREDFNLDFIALYGKRYFKNLKFNDQMATLAEFSAASIYQSYAKFLPTMPKKIIFSGGGTKNTFLMKRLKIYFSQSECLTSEDLGWPNESIEGATFAYLAHQRLNKKKMDIRAFTGGRPGLLGQICEP